MENLGGSNINEVERLSILSIQKQEIIIESIRKNISELEESISFFNEQINSLDVPEEDKKNYLEHVEQLRAQVVEYEQAIQVLEKAIQILSSSILENTNTVPNSKAN